MNSCIKMVHDELEDFATPYSIVYPSDNDEYVYDNEQFNNESSDSMDSEMYYNYGDEYFY
jgi:hypothetical protein